MSVAVKSGMLFGKYRLERLLGHGGMASVWLARHTLLETPFAVKILDPAVAERDPRYVERFMREARLASRIHHPHLVGVYDVGKDPATGLYYLVMEYVPGGNVAQLLAKEGPLAEKTALDIVRQVAEALGQAERFGMVHRDIKPDNIMFDEQGEAKLSDLGIAKADLGDDPNLTQTAAVFGTPAYMSPEQATDAGKVDVRADIYSLGVVCYEMLSGHRPYAGKSITEILARVVDKAPPPDVRSIRPDVSQKTATLVRTMMDKECSRRPASVRDLLERLRELEPEHPAPPTYDAARTMPTTDAVSQETLPTQTVAAEAADSRPILPSMGHRIFILLRRRWMRVMLLAGVVVLLGMGLAWFSFRQKASKAPPHMSLEPTQPTSAELFPSEHAERSIPKPSSSPDGSAGARHSPSREQRAARFTEMLSKESTADPECPPPREPASGPSLEPSVTVRPEADTATVRLAPSPVEAETENDHTLESVLLPHAERNEGTENTPQRREASVKTDEGASQNADASAPPVAPLSVTLHLLLGTREITQAEVTVVAEGRPVHFPKGPYVFETLPGKSFDVSVARGNNEKERWRAVVARRMTVGDSPHVTLLLSAETVEPKRIQGLSVVEDGRPVAAIQGRFRKFGGKSKAFGPCTPEELADFLRRNAPGDGNYWLFLERSDGSEASFCPAKIPRRAGDVQPYHAGMRLDLTNESADLYEIPPPED